MDTKVKLIGSGRRLRGGAGPLNLPSSVSGLKGGSYAISDAPPGFQDPEAKKWWEKKHGKIKKKKHRKKKKGGGCPTDAKSPFCA